MYVDVRLVAEALFELLLDGRGVLVGDGEGRVAGHAQVHLYRHAVAEAARVPAFIVVMRDLQAIILKLPVELKLVILDFFLGRLPFFLEEAILKGQLHITLKYVTEILRTSLQRMLLSSCVQFTEIMKLSAVMWIQEKLNNFILH